VASVGDQQAFQLRDDHGTIRIQPQGADIRALSVWSDTCGRSDPRYFSKGPAHELCSSDHRRRFEETAILVATTLCVIGQARERQAVSGLEITRDPLAPVFVISIKDEHAVAAGYRWSAIGWAWAWWRF
jgi:hypothetical protein